MTLNEIKAKRVLRALGDRLPKPVVESVTVEYDVDESGVYSNARVVTEGKKKKKSTPKFVQDCVSGITKKSKAPTHGEPDDDDDDDEKNTDGKTPRPTLTDYETALKKLRVENHQTSPDRGSVVFEAASTELKKLDRSRIVYRPRG